MKKLIFIVKAVMLIACLLLVLTAKSQTRATKDAHGNYTALRRSDTSANKATGHTFTDSKGKVYPLYISVNGKLFYYRTSRYGNVYKAYIKAS